ncbi:MAG: YqaJ viral recombinase family protein [Lachnospiraceae bacterium]|nr:YqaJ viral recombinase family protein [Lachnospiraceae bacterium]
MKANILVETEGLSYEEWLNWRRKGIGGSDVAALLGISKWKSPVELWLEKTGQVTDLPADNEAMQWGRIMEPVIRQHFKEVTGKNVIEIHAIMQHPKHKFMLADVDGITVDDSGDPAVLEIKTASEYKRAEWEDGLPVYYNSQCQHYLAVTGLEKAYVAVLIGGNTFKLYEIDADKEVQRMLIKVESDFWKMVKNGTRPNIDGSNASKELLDKTYAGGCMDAFELPEEAVAYITGYIEASEQEDTAKAKKQELSNKLKEMMGDHEKALCGDHAVSWTTVVSERLDTKALKENEPDVYGRYVKTSTSRRFSVK